jgi:hypothetical protein
MSCLASNSATTASDNDHMHAGELELSILSTVWPDAVRPAATAADHLAPERSMLLVHGMSAYTDSGVIGQPSAGTPAKGKAILDSLVGSFTHTSKPLACRATGHVGTARTTRTSRVNQCRVARPRTRPCRHTIRCRGQPRDRGRTRAGSIRWPR